MTIGPVNGQKTSTGIMVGGYSFKLYAKTCYNHIPYGEATGFEPHTSPKVNQTLVNAPHLVHWLIHPTLIF